MGPLGQYYELRQNFKFLKELAKVVSYAFSYVTIILNQRPELQCIFARNSILITLIFYLQRSLMSLMRENILFSQRIFISYTVKLYLGNIAELIVQNFTTLKTQMFCLLMSKTKWYFLPQTHSEPHFFFAELNSRASAKPSRIKQCSRGTVQTGLTPTAEQSVSGLVSLSSLSGTHRFAVPGFTWPPGPL